MSVRVKRAYEAPAKSDGFRVLVDRLWPRGVSKEAARIDLWAKDLAPSAELRRFFGHDPERWPEFRQRYFRELSSEEELLQPLERRARRGRLTLVYGAKEERYNNAVALKEFLERRV